MNLTTLPQPDSLSSEMEEVSPTNSKSKWRTSFVILGLALLVIGLAAAVFFYGSYQKIVVKKSTPLGATPQPSPTPDPFRPTTILLMGYGGGGHAGGKLTDSMMIAYIDPRPKKIYLISLPRDMWVKLPVGPSGELYSKINAAYAIGSDDKRYTTKPVEYTGEAGGGELAKHAVSQTLGFPIDHFVAIDFYGFRKTIDVIGGVDVKVERSFDDFLYPIEGKEEDTCGKSEEEIQAVATMSATDREKAFECRYEQLHFDKGVVRMNGETALKFSRSRHSNQDGGDFGRAARQRALLVAVKQKVLKIDFIPKIIPFIQSLAGNVQTDIDLGQMEKFIAQKDELTEFEIIGIAVTDKTGLQYGRSSDGQSILIPTSGQDQWGSLHDWVKQEMASPSAKPITPALTGPTGTSSATPRVSTPSATPL